MTEEKLISNPFRSIGLLHNEGLDFVVQNLKPEEVTTDRIQKLCAEYMLKLTNSSKKIDLAFYCSIAASSENALALTPFNEMLTKAGVTDRGLCLVNELLNVSEDFDFPTMLKVIENAEANILRADMTAKEKELPLMCAAVAKASVEYWIQQINAEKSAWAPFIEGDVQKFRWPWRADAEGAVGGAISGAISGLGNPVNIIGGAVIGAIFGSVVAALR